MARMSIFNPNMAKLLPKFMKADETDVALSHAMDVLLAKPANKSKILRKWDQIDNMNDAQLDEMAWEFNIDWWDSSFSLETKRSVIRTCYRVHEKRGTKWAVEELITSAFGMGKVTEWFEYGGQPYWFKIQTSATLTKDGMLYFLNMIDKVKNARSHVEMIEVTRTIQQPLHGGTAHHSFSKCVVLDHFQETTQGRNHSARRNRPRILPQPQQHYGLLCVGILCGHCVECRHGSRPEPKQSGSNRTF